MWEQGKNVFTGVCGKMRRKESLQGPCGAPAYKGTILSQAITLPSRSLARVEDLLFFAPLPHSWTWRILIALITLTFISKLALYQVFSKCFGMNFITLTQRPWMGDFIYIINQCNKVQRGELNGPRLELVIAELEVKLSSGLGECPQVLCSLLVKKNKRSSPDLKRSLISN